MKKKYLWAILAAALVLILVLAVTMPRAESKEKAAESEEAQTDAPASEPEPQQTAEPEEDPEETSFGGAPGELPLDTTQPKVVSASAPEQSSQSAEQGEIAPAEDPATGMELEEDELPIVAP